MKHIHGGNVYQHREVEDFSANINFRGMPESVRKAAHEAVDGSVHYPEPESRNLCEILAKLEQVRPEEIICGNGAAEILFLLVSALQPKHAVLAQPCFFEYEQALETIGCRITHVFLKETDGFAVGNELTGQIPDDTDLLILGNPNNPTGKKIDAPVLEEIIAFCREHQILLVLDESFFDFLAKEDRQKTVEGTERIEGGNLFILKSFTKMYAIPGLRFGYGISSDRELMERMKRMTQPWNVSLPAQKAAAASAEEYRFAEETAEQTAENRRILAEGLRRVGFTVFDSCTNFLLLKGPEGLDQACLSDGILIRDCSNFRGLKAGYFRICVRSKKENERLLSVLERCRRCLDAEKKTELQEAEESPER